MMQSEPMLSRLLLRSARETASIRRKGQIRNREPSEYVSCWKEEESLDGRDCTAFVVILATRGCLWALRSGCSMCGYTNESSLHATATDVLTQYRKAMASYSGEEVIKIYTSGSFLDNFETTPELRRSILLDACSRARKVVVETRHEYITKERMEELVPFSDRVELAVGVESSSDLVLSYSVNKPSRFSNFVRQARIASEFGVPIKSYVMLKPPFLSEEDAIADAVATCNDVAPYVREISVNPTNIQKGTVVEMLWQRGNYRPPWLWSVVEVLRRTHSLNTRVLSKPTGAGTLRGAHNCGCCDGAVLKAIADYSRHRNISSLELLDCHCRSVWNRELELCSIAEPPYSKDYRTGRCSWNAGI